MSLVCFSIGLIITWAAIISAQVSDSANIAQKQSAETQTGVTTIAKSMSLGDPLAKDQTALSLKDSTGIDSLPKKTHQSAPPVMSDTTRSDTATSSTHSLDSTSSPSHSKDTQPSDSSFFTAQERELRRQYRLCTGDSSEQTLSNILGWRNQLEQKMETDEYQALRRQYLSLKADVTSFIPCEVFKWHRARLDSIRHKEDELQQRAAGQAFEALDSATLATHIASLPKSPFDLESIPFGTSREMVRDFCTREWNLALQQRSTYSFANGFHIDGKPFSIIFFYNKDDKLERYEIESPSTYGPDSLDLQVRGQVRHLTRFYESRIGPPDRLYRIGFFDIKAGHLTPYARWEDNGYVAIVGIVRDKQRYFAKARILSRRTTGPQ